MQRHVHAGADRGSVDHRDGRLADQRDVAVQLGEAVKEMLPCAVRPFMRAAIAGKVLAGDSAVALDPRLAPEQKPRPTPVSTMTRTLGSSSPARMYSPTLATVPFSSDDADQRVHPLRAVELDPQDAAVFRFVEQMVDQPWSHGVFLLCLLCARSCVWRACRYVARIRSSAVLKCLRRFVEDPMAGMRDHLDRDIGASLAQQSHAHVQHRAVGHFMLAPESRARARGRAATLRATRGTST